MKRKKKIVDEFDDEGNILYISKWDNDEWVINDQLFYGEFNAQTEYDNIYEEEDFNFDPHLNFRWNK